MRKLIFLALIMACSKPTPTEPKVECIDANLFRNSVMWPTFAGTAECPLPADHPKCVAETERYCETVAKDGTSVRVTPPPPFVYVVDMTTYDLTLETDTANKKVYLHVGKKFEFPNTTLRKP